MLAILDLPPEIRNQIWDLCLVSPTGVISPISRRDAYYSGFPSSCSRSGPFFYLQVEGERSLVKQPQTFCPHAKPLSTVSLSLPRTCRKIFMETNDLFWAKNTFYFPTPHRLLSNFKSMGQYPQRRITSLRLSTSPWVGNDAKWLDKALQLLISQGKSSSLQRLDILIDKRTILRMSKPDLCTFSQDLWIERLRPCLPKTRYLRGVEKKLVVTDAGDFTKAATLSEGLEGTLWEIQAWGFKVHWGSKLLFEDMSGNEKESPSNELLRGNDGVWDTEMALLGWRDRGKRRIRHNMGSFMAYHTIQKVKIA